MPSWYPNKPAYKNGGPGSVFRRQIINSEPHLCLFVDGGNRDVFKYVTIINEEERIVLDHLDFLELKNEASLQIKAHGEENVKISNLNIDVFRGDKSGLIHGHKDHVISIEVESDSHNAYYSRPYVNFIMDEESEMFAARRFQV